MAKDGPDIIRLSYVVAVFISLLLPQVMCLLRKPCKDIWATDKIDYFQLPTVPYTGKYARSTFQCFIIRAEPRWDKVKISFLSFMLEPDLRCSHDNLTIFDGDDYGSDRIGIFCGSDIPDDIVSDDDALYMEFRSDDYLEYGGFKLSYIAGEEDDWEDSMEKSDKSGEYDNNSYYNNKKHKLTTVIVIGIIGGLVLITGIVATVCICFSTRRCRCRSGSSSVNPSDERGERGDTSNRRTFLHRTDRSSRDNSQANSSLPHAERQETGFPFPVFLPTYTEASPPPPYNGHEMIELQRLPSSPPPPYTPNDPNPLFVSLGDINAPSYPGEITCRY